MEEKVLEGREGREGQAEASRGWEADAGSRCRRWKGNQHLSTSARCPGAATSRAVQSREDPWPQSPESQHPHRVREQSTASSRVFPVGGVPTPPGLLLFRWKLAMLLSAFSVCRSPITCPSPRLPLEDTRGAHVCISSTRPGLPVGPATRAVQVLNTDPPDSP